LRTFCTIDAAATFFGGILKAPSSATQERLLASRVLCDELNRQMGGSMMDTTAIIPANQALSHDTLKAALPIKPIWLLAFGVLLVVLGALAFISVVTATIVSVYFVAVTMVMAGVAEIMLGLQSRSPRRKLMWVLVGILYVGAGLFAFFNPLLAASVLTLLLGASLVGAGILRFLLSFQMRSDRQWWWVTLSAAITALLGMMVLTQWPASSLYILGVFLSVDLIFAGLCWLMIGTAAMSRTDVTAASTT
jgi:uncharacterized membrane protein HdeD (DUF308 family)